MWSFASKAFSSKIGLKSDVLKTRTSPSECSDDERSLNNSREEGLECPICWECFNTVENVPYVLWCGHTLCKNCVLGLQRAIVKLPTLPIQLPFFIYCPWCNLLAFRLVYKGNLRFPRKNYFVLWTVESMNGDRSKSLGEGHHSVCSSNKNSGTGNQIGQTNNTQAPGIHVSRQSHHPTIMELNLASSTLKDFNYLSVILWYSLFM